MATAPAALVMTATCAYCSRIRVFPGWTALFPRRDSADRRGQHTGSSSPCYRHWIWRLPLRQDQESSIRYDGVVPRTYSRTELACQLSLLIRHVTKRKCIFMTIISALHSTMFER